MSKKISVTSPGASTDPEQIAAERHVIEIMGPAWSNGSSTADSSRPTLAEEVMTTAVPHTEDSVIQNDATGSISAQLPPTAQHSVTNPSTDIETPKTEGQVVEDAVKETIINSDNQPPSSKEGEKITAPPVVMKESLFDKFKEAFYRWWDNKVARYLILGVLLGILGVVIGVPVVRTNTMNFLGFRASVSVYTVDATTLQPLSGVTLSVGDVSTKTEENGKAKLTDVKLGKQKVVIHKAGFADVKEDVTFGFRAIDLGEVDLKATGLQRTFVFTDYLSGKPIQDVTLESGEASTKSDKNGKAIITLAPDMTVDVISIHKNGYRTEQTSVGDSDSAKLMKLVLAAKEIYIARENGVYNLKKVDLDGKNTAVLLPGTGTETSSIDVSVDPLSQYAALISTRDTLKNKEGYLLSALTLVNVATGDSETIEHAEKLTIVGWSGTTLVYRQIVAGTSAANSNREKLMAYNYANDKRYQIATANHFLGALIHKTTVYFAVSATDPAAKSGLMSVALDGSAKKTLQEGDVWAFYRADYKTVKLQTADKWYAYVFGGSAVETPAAATVMRSYLDSGDAKLSIWSDPATTSGVLSLYNIATGKDQVLTKTKGQYKPLRWINNRVLVYREATKTGATDYILSLDGGEARKLADTYNF